MKKLLFLAVPLLLLVGCAHTETSLSVDWQKHALGWHSPKDITFNKAVFTKDLTNGVETIEVDGWKSSNNPEVLKAAGDANVQMVNAVGAQLNQAVQTGANLYASGGATAAQAVLNQGIAKALNKPAVVNTNQ